MTEKEAIGRLKDHFDRHCDSRPTSYLDEAVSMAIATLEKQIPKKIKYLNRHGSGLDLYNTDYYNCPSCGRRLRNKQHDKHCGRCGQLLDWEIDGNE